MTALKPYLKGAFAGLVAVAALLAGGAFLDDSHLDAKEAAGVLSTFLVAAGGVFVLPYQSTKDETDV